MLIYSPLYQVKLNREKEQQTCQASVDKREISVPDPISLLFIEKTGSAAT